MGRQHTRIVPTSHNVRLRNTSARKHTQARNNRANPSLAVTYTYMFRFFQVFRPMRPPHQHVQREDLLDLVVLDGVRRVRVNHQLLHLGFTVKHIL